MRLLSGYYRSLLLPAFALIGISCAPLTVDTLCRVTVSIQGRGSVYGIQRDTLLHRGDTLHLAAYPDPGMVFFGWRYGTFSS
ncbi:MAG: hypothetical protein JXA71_15080, partial [Chitinispirillaceae bacterium]|nr:hypothetical protein [Chitinispirillaceae bacterium]